MIFLLDGDRYRIADPRRFGRSMIDYLRAILAPTDFDRVEPGPDEAPEDFLNRQSECAVAVAVPFVAAMLVPEGRLEADWSPTLAKRTERRLRRLEGPTVQGNIEDVARLCAKLLLAAVVSPEPAPAIH